MRALAAALLLAGCAAQPAVPPLSAGSDPLRPGPNGIAVAGTDLEIGFGRAQEGAAEAVTRLVGPPDAQSPCPGGGAVLVWPMGLAMHFPDGTFTGWAQDGRSAGRLCDVS